LRGSLQRIRRELYTGTVDDLAIDSDRMLTGRNAELYTDLDRYSRGVQTWKAVQPDFNIYIQTKEGAKTSDNQTGAAGIFTDSAFNKSRIAHIDDAMLALTWSLTKWRDGIFDMGFFDAKKDIALNRSELSQATDKFFRSTLAIGGFENNSSVKAAAFTYGAIASSNGSHLFAINLITDDLPLDETVGHIFHEVLHNFGFMHGSNAIVDYQDRSVAILAFEYIMSSFIRYFVLDKCDAENLLQDCSIFGAYPVAGREPMTISPTKVQGNEEPKRKDLLKNAAIVCALATASGLFFYLSYKRYRRNQALMTLLPYLPHTHSKERSLT
jgi:hypothetical protein